MNMHRFAAAVCVSVFIFFIPPASGTTFEQQSLAGASGETARGIALYRQGNIKEAIEVLRKAVKQSKEDADAWYYLGLALNREGEVKDSRKAFEKAVKLRPNFAGAHVGLAYALLLSRKSREAEREAIRAIGLDGRNVEAMYIVGTARLQAGNSKSALEEAEAALKVNPQYAPAYFLKSQALLGAVSDLPFISGDEPPDSRSARTKQQNQRLREAADNLERFLRLSPNASNAALWREQLDTLRVHSSSVDATAGQYTVFNSTEVSRRATLLSKPEPSFPESARRNDISGTVKLRLVLAADGTIRNVLVLRSLSHGLTEAAVNAARGIRFSPAIKDGRPVSQIAVIEYSFNIF